MTVVYAFWNNKGGTGKTSLAFQTVARYAKHHHASKILIVDACPQANMSELLLGGLESGGSHNVLELHDLKGRKSLGGYFQLRLPNPYNVPRFDCDDFIINVSDYNEHMPTNIDLLCGDPILELQSNAINTLANNNIPGTNTWIKVIDWIRDFINACDGTYDTVFIDCNPSFSIYTQIALASSDRIILPVMADDSSRRAIQNALSLVYGLRIPSDIYATYMFKTKLETEHREIPKVHLVVKNRITQYMGSASAYDAVLSMIKNDVKEIRESNPDFFTFNNVDDGFVDIRDFQTTGVISFAKGIPFFKMTHGRKTLNGRKIAIRKEYLEKCQQEITVLAGKL